MHGNSEHRGTRRGRGKSFLHHRKYRYFPEYLRKDGQLPSFRKGCCVGTQRMSTQVIGWSAFLAEDAHGKRDMSQHGRLVLPFLLAGMQVVLLAGLRAPIAAVRAVPDLLRAVKYGLRATV